MDANLTLDVFNESTTRNNPAEFLTDMVSDKSFHPLATTLAQDVESSPWHTSTYKTAILTSFAVIVSLITILANMTIIILASTDKKLRKMNSYLIINLACMDLIVGLFVIPCMSAYNILGYWPLGNFVCDLWTCIDFMCCTASFFNLCVISWDRFGAVTRPLQYRSQTRGKLKVFGLIMLPWIASGLSWVPAIAAWRVVLGYAGDGECIYLTDKYYVLLSNIFVYCIPMAGIIYLYGRVWFAVKIQMQNLMDEDSSDSKANITDKKGGNAAPNALALSNDGFQGDDGQSPRVDPSDVTFPDDVDIDALEDSGVSISVYRRQIAREMSSNISVDLSTNDLKSLKNMANRGGTTGKQMERERLKKYHLARMMTHRRTTKTLGIIVTVFLICWIPWTILYPLNGFCRCVPNWMYIACYWTAYLNSTFNPFLYGFNRDYRKAFKRIIIDRCLCKSDTK